MRAVTILRSRLKNALGMMHTKRRRALWRAVYGLVAGGRLSLTALGRSRPGRAKKKHQIKAIDRLLGNRHLHGEQTDVYRAITKLLVAADSRPVILVDWSRLDDDLHALVASVPIGGRALPLLQEVHPEKRLTHPRVHLQFLKRLKTLLPDACRPVVVTDAGFRVSWFEAVLRQGWDFVGRTRGRTLVQGDDGQWVSAKSLYAKARPAARCLGWQLLTRRNAHHCRLAIVRKRRKPGPKVSNGGHSSPQEKYRKREQEPWLLATSLGAGYPAHRLVGFYKMRMQIEETFRDEKNPRFGWSLCHARSKFPKRYEVLLLIGALGLIAMTVLGLAAEDAGLHRSHQANTIRTRRVLSFFVLARYLVQAEDEERLPKAALRSQFESIRQLTDNGWPQGER
jgi:hypothetical protein